MAPENTLREESQHLARKLQWGRSRVAPDNNTYDTTGFPLYLLQWGRSQSAPENLRDLAAFVQVDRDASMGPEPIGSGKHLPWLLRSSCIIVLQWGRSQSAPENAAGGRCRPPSRRGFNGAGANRLRKTAALSTKDHCALAKTVARGRSVPGAQPPFTLSAQFFSYRIFQFSKTLCRCERSRPFARHRTARVHAADPVTPPRPSSRWPETACRCSPP